MPAAAACSKVALSPPPSSPVRRFSARWKPSQRVTHKVAAPAWFAGRVLPHLLFRWLYYGHLLPNTFYAKTGISLIHLTHGLRYTGKFLVDYGLWGLAPLAVLALLARRRTRARTAYFALLIFANIAYVTLIGGDTMVENRLYMPVVALLAAAFTEAARVAML